MLSTDRKGLEERCEAGDLEKAERLIDHGRVRILIHQRFLSYLLIRIPCVPAYGSIAIGEFNTMATDGRRIYYDPKFVSGLNVVDVSSILMHELLHCILEHHLRIEGRMPLLWNIATDYAVNDLLKEQFDIDMPRDTLLDRKYHEMPAEEIYSLLAQDMNMQVFVVGGGDDGEGGGGGGGAAKAFSDQRLRGDVIAPGEVPPMEDDEEQGRVANNWPGIAASAISDIKSHGGEVNSFFDRQFDLERKPDDAWITAVWQHMTPAKIQRSWKRPNRRFISQGIYLPSKSGEAIKYAVLIQDTSGSVSEEELGLFGNVFLRVVSETRPQELLFMSADTQSREFHRFTTEDYPITEVPTPKGGGGTSFKEAIEYAVEISDQEPTVLIYLTDLELPEEYFGEEPDFPVLWVSTTERVAPWGETVQLKDITNA